MKLNRLIVYFDDSERDALADLAAADCRDSRDQLRYLVRVEAERRGLSQGLATPVGESAHEAECTRQSQEVNRAPGC